ncbi:IS3 family transposase [Herbaspirillum sp. WKF16]|uniref:IS3 family transposase n=1 Tax=Herbaspirillum sp. WKF16 TaxID=3028312 RepID=UPI0023A91784|nr:IS3 family transposase [Herbaspirillum sp. WKF16]WDZ97364.1 IS3 family transposase [Herbaspirillum sp. WKF16]
MPWIANTTATTRQQQRELIDHQRPQACSIRRGCQMIDLPHSTYYYQPKPATAALSDHELAQLIGDIHDVFPGYGYRRITLELKARGHVVNHKRVARIVREHEVYGHHRRRFKSVAGSEIDVAVFPSRYRNVIPTEPDRVWGADITYIRMVSGFIYLAVVLDACSRKVIGYALSKRIDTPLALAALTAAYRIRKPAPGTRIHHADREWQYGSALYQEALDEFGLIGSMSAPANPYHNAQAESFMKTLKVEEIYLAGYEKFDDVARRLPYFLEEICNERRMHSALGYQSPNHFEAQFALQAA